MSNGPIGVVLRHLGRLAAVESHAESDAELLTRFLARRDEAAFGVLMRRHGPMVLSVCGRVLGHAQDAEDAFQTTFLTLAQRAGSIHKRESLSSWLHGVAFRLSARTRARRRDVSAAIHASAPAPAEGPLAAAAWRELQALLDEEVQRLPDVCRAALVHCYLEGASHEEAAARLGWPLGSVKSRLTRARQLLRARLARRGVGLSGGALAAFLAADGAAATLPARLLTATALAIRQAVEVGATATCVNTLGRLWFARKGAASVVLAATALALVGAAVLTSGNGGPDVPPAPDQQQPPPAAAAADEGPPPDLHGDGLPQGALLRFGSLGLRHGVNLRAAVFSPTEDILVSSGAGPTVVWDPATGKELRRHKAASGGYAKIVFAPDGAALATDDKDDVLLMDVKTGREIRRFAGHKGPIAALGFNGRGDRLASVARDRTVRLWDTTTGKELLRIDDALEQEPHSIALSPDGAFIISAGYEKAVKVWDAVTGKELRRFTIGEGSFQNAVLSRDGAMVATCDENRVRLWDAATAKELRPLEGAVGRGYVAFAPDGKILVHGDGEGFVRIWQTATGKKLREFRVHPSNVNSVSFSRDGTTLATGFADSPIHLWDVAAGTRKLTLAGHQERLLTAAWSPDGKRVASGGWDGVVRVWDTAGKELLRLEGKFNRVARVAFSADGTRLFASVVDEQRAPYMTMRASVMIWDAATGKLLGALEGSSPTITRDGRLFAAVIHEQKGNVIVVRDVATGKDLHRLSGVKSNVRELEFSADGRSLTALVQNVLLGFRVAGEEERLDANAVHVWDLESGRKLRAFGSKRFATALSVAPDGRTVTTCDFRDSNVQLWEILTGQERGAAVGHKDMVFAAAFAPDGRRLATGGMDGTLRVWDVPSMKELRRFEGHSGWVLGLAWSPDGTKIVTTSTDTTALVWDVSDLRPPDAKQLSQTELDAAWADLLGSGRGAYAVIGVLAAAPAQATTYLAERLKPPPALAPEVLARRIADLKDEKFAVRDAATKELEKTGATSEAALRKALEAANELEERRRIEAVLERIANQRLRELRAVEALERIGSDEARALLRVLAAGTTAAAPEAAASLRRTGR